MIQIHQYHLPPTDLIPNSPRPLLHYKNVLPRDPTTKKCSPADTWALFTSNSWSVHWIFRYSHTQVSHYHSQAHECMAVLSGTARIRFGVADTSPDMDANTDGPAHEAGGVELDAEAGDVFVIPAGVAHKTHHTRPAADLALLSPGRGHGIEAEDPKAALGEVQLDGFTMMGAYCGGDWDFLAAGGEFETVWAVPKPRLDPVWGSSPVGLRKTWVGSGAPARAKI